MNHLNGTIYIRDNELCRLKNIYKLGMASFAKNRDDTYITYEHEKGEFIFIVEIPINIMKLVDKYLKTYFKSYNNYILYGGTEYYSRSIIDLIIPALDEYKKTCYEHFEYKILTKEEILLINRLEQIQNIKNIQNIKKIFNQLTIEKLRKYNNKNKNTIINPNECQQYILNIITEFFYLNNIGKIIWACGLGKALLSILIVNLLKFKSIVFGIPNNNLQKQIKNEILKIFPNKNNILFVGGDENDGIKATTDKKQIIQFLNNKLNFEPKFVISTYHSCHLLVDNDINFEFKIGDEAHHLVGLEKDEKKGFCLFHKINSLKTLFMTATEKTIQTQINKEIYSMGNETIFGKYIDVKSIHWAIENKKITDYNILVLKNTEDEVDEIISDLRLNIINKEIFISCYMCLKSFEKYNDLTHLLLYTNTTDDAELAKKYINEILSLNIFLIPKEKIYNNCLHSKNCNDLDSEVYKFRNTSYGIISCVYIFGEGFDLPKINGVCITGNMQSEIRIVQYLLRPNRLDIENPNKKAYVIIPYIDSDDWETENKSYEKVRNIISQMRNVDENIEQKIFVSVGEKKKKKKPKKDAGQKDFNEDYIFEENMIELNKIKLRLRYSKALGSIFTEEQDEYNYVRSINLTLNIKSKKEYIQQQDTHSNFIASPEEYFKLKGVWNNWYDFMGVDTTKFIQSKQEWINFCRVKSIKSLDDYYIYCEEYDILPKEPDEFYSHFANIPNELEFNRSRR